MKKRSVNLRGDSGQALVELVLMVPILLTIILNAVNFAYFFLMVLNITSAARSSGLYSITGSATPSAIALPVEVSATTVLSPSYLAIQDLTGAVPSASTNVGGQVCTPSLGVSNAGTKTQASNCQTFGSGGTFAAPDPDPELNAAGTAPAFSLNRIDVAYTFTPPLPQTPFNLLILVSSNCSSGGGSVSCTFYRHTEMRAMN